VRRLSWIVTLPLMLIGVVFAVVNRQAVEVRLWPLEIELQAPLFVVVLLAVFVGFVLGGVATWFAAGRRRRVAREEHHRLRQLEQQVADLRREREHSLLPRSPAA